MTNYFNTNEANPVLNKIIRKIIKKYPYYQNSKIYKIKLVIDSMINDVFKINQIIDNLSTIQCGFDDEDSALVYIANNGSSQFLKASKIYTQIALEQFGTGQLACRLYGKNIKPYIKDIIALIKPNAFESVTNTCYKKAMIKIIERVTLVAVSLAVYYLYIIYILFLSSNFMIRLMNMAILFTRL